MLEENVPHQPMFITIREKMFVAAGMVVVGKGVFYQSLLLNAFKMLQIANGFIPKSLDISKLFNSKMITNLLTKQVQKIPSI